jgi:hypothetical protein
MIVRSLLFALLLVVSPELPADASAGLTSQLRARQVLDAAVAAIGGEAPLRELQSIRREYLEDWVDVGQGQRPWTGTPAAAELPPHAGFDDSQGVSYLDYAGNRYAEWIRYADAPTDYAIVRDVAAGDRGFQAITYVREMPFYKALAPEDVASERLRRFRRHPEGLLRMALDRVATLLSLGSARENGRLLDVISFADAAGHASLLYFDADQHRLVRAESLRSHTVYVDTQSDTLYADYRRVGRLLLPHAVTDRTAGVPVRRIRVEHMALDESAPDAWFEAPAEYAEVVSNPAAPRLELLGGGLYLIRGSYNLMAAEFADHVLLIEAPAGTQYLEDCLALIERAIPGKPVHLVATHFHFDHIAGVRAAIARGIPILTTADTSRVIEQAAASRQTLRPDAQARNPSAPIIEIAGSRTVVDDGSQRVELYDFGPTPHVAEILVAGSRNSNCCTSPTCSTC